MLGLLQLSALLASNVFLAGALPIVERGVSVSSSSSFTLSGWNDLCGSCFSDNLYFSNLCFELGSVGFNFALSESADVCVQQQVADQMIFLAKSSSISVSESSELIAYAVGFYGLPRSVGHVVGFSRSVSACTVPPLNPELSGSTSSVGISNGPISSIPTSSSSSSSIPVSGSSSISSGSLGDGTSTSTSDLGNSTDISGNSTLTGSDSTNSTDFSGSNSTDTSNSTLTGTDSSNSTDTSASDSTDTSTDSTDTSTATDSSIDTSTDTSIATATESSVATATDSSTAATATSSQTFDGNIHDPAGRRRLRRRL